MKPEILLTARSEQIEQRLKRNFELHFLSDYAHRTECLAAIGSEISGIFYANTGGRIGESVFDRMPKLEIVSVVSTGVDHVNVVAANDRGIVVTNAPGVHSSDVAEFAMGLLIGIGRNMGGGVYHVRSGEWQERQIPPTRRLSGRPLGILGLGSIGMEVARRAEAFNMPVYYHNRSFRIDAPYTYVDSLLELARRVDFLIVAAPGGEQTHHLVNREVLDALGPEGILVNVGRGSVVDTEAMIGALGDGTLGAAAIDVIEGEPAVPSAMFMVPNLLITPHMASRTTDSLVCAYHLAADNLEAHFAGKRVPSLVTL